jgi:hypothetical protein
MLSKNYKNRIQLLSGVLFEGKYSNKIKNIIGLPSDLATEMEDLYGKYSVWVGDTYRKYITKLLLDKVIVFEQIVNISKKDIDLLFKEEDEDFYKFLIYHWEKKYKEELYDYVYDWLRRRSSGPVIETDELNFRELTAIQAYRKSYDWHKKVEKIQTGIIEDEHGDVVIKFPDGYYWIKLESSKCDDEAKAMGHCGAGTKGGNLYSLRKDKKPVVTADVINGSLKQIRGKANTKPLPKYHKYIFDFLLSDIVKDINYGGWKIDGNFHISDLKQNKYIDEIINKKPELLKGQSFESFDDEIIEKIVKINPNLIPLSSLFDELDLESIEENLLDKEWWELIDKKRKEGLIDLDNYGNIFQVVFNAFEKSGKKFHELIKNKLNNDKNFIKLIIFYDLKNLGHNLKLISNFFDENSKDLLLKAFIDKDVLNSFLKNNELYKYINFIIRDDIFGVYGLKFALKLMGNEKIKKQFIKERNQESYELTLDVINDSI